MLTSKHPAAYAALFRTVMRYAATPLDFALQTIERRWIEGSGGQSHPVVLVVGGARTGTTLVYEVLARHLPVTYTANVVEVFPRSPLVASRLFERLTREWRSQNAGYNSYYGNTARLGAPNDGFDIWNRWMGVNRYTSVDRLSAGETNEMRAFFETWTAKFDRPLVNKNNRNSGAIALLAEALPQAHFVIVRRKAVFVAQSLLIARKMVQGDASKGWGLASQPEDEDAIRSVCVQVAKVDAIIQRQLDAVDPKRITPIEYERFCSDPAEAVTKIGRVLGSTPVEIDRLRSFDDTNHRRLSESDFDRLQIEADRLLT
jgi:hypothetical protein